MEFVVRLNPRTQMALIDGLHPNVKGG